MTLLASQRVFCLRLPHDGVSPDLQHSLNSPNDFVLPDDESPYRPLIAASFEGSETAAAHVVSIRECPVYVQPHICPILTHDVYALHSR